jgi:outer membrane protein assembly factor BamB
MRAFVLIAVLGSASGAAVVQAQWPQWGGPTRDFQAPSSGLAETWPKEGPPVLWSRPLGTGHSSIVVDDGRLFTLYRAGNGRAKAGPWDTEEAVVALDAKTGQTIWEHKYSARSGYEDFSFGPAPHSTPLVVGDRLFTIGTNQQLFAFDKKTGKILWSRDFIKDFRSPELLIRPQVKTGYGCSPIAFRDTIICSVGGPGQSVMAFRQSDGGVVWKNGDFLTSSAAPILIVMGGRLQAVFFGGAAVHGLDPANGAILWSHPHDPGNDLNMTTPLFGPDNVLFLSSAYQAGSRAIQLRDTPEGTETTDLWFTNRVRFMFLSAVRIGNFVYGTSGDFGPSFLTALNIKTGESAWQVRGFARSSLVAADGKVIAMSEDGDLVLARMSPEGADILARTKLFDTMSWTAPTIVGTTLYVRDREKIVALDLGIKDDKRGYAGSVLGFVDPKSPPSPPRAFPASFAGSWQLDTAGSTTTAGVAFAGLRPAGGPTWLFATQPANGTLVLESPINSAHARFYRPGGSTTTEIGNGTITMTTSWVGKELVAQGSITLSNGEVTNVTEKISRDGNALIVTITSGDKTTRLRYLPLTDVGPCTSWPTPCKKAPG